MGLWDVSSAYSDPDFLESSSNLNLQGMKETSELFYSLDTRCHTHTRKQYKKYNPHCTVLIKAIQFFMSEV